MDWLQSAYRHCICKAWPLNIPLPTTQPSLEYVLLDTFISYYNNNDNNNNNNNNSNINAGDTAPEDHKGTNTEDPDELVTRKGDQGGEKNDISSDGNQISTKDVTNQPTTTTPTGITLVEGIIEKVIKGPLQAQSLSFRIFQRDTDNNTMDNNEKNNEKKWRILSNISELQERQVTDSFPMYRTSYFSKRRQQYQLLFWLFIIIIMIYRWRVYWIGM